MIQDINTIWPKVLDELRKRVTEQQFNTWFRHLEPEGVFGKKVELRVPSPIYKEWLARRYKTLVEEAFSSVSNGPVSVSFTQGLPPSSSTFYEPGSAAGASPLAPQTYLNRKYTFDNFIVGQCNRLAHAAALSVVSSPGYTYNPLFIYGGPGLGKSHLLQAIYFAVAAKGSKALYIPCSGFISHFILALRNQQLEGLRKTYRELDILLLDDVQQISRSSSTREELFHTINALFNKQRQIVLAADTSPDALPGVEERLISRFKWGLVAKLEPADLETNVAIIERTAILLNLSLSREAVLFLAESAPNNLKELERVTSFLSSTYAGYRLPLTLSQVKQTLTGILPLKSHAFHMEDILRAVTAFFRIPQAQLQSKSRARSVSLPRQVAMYLARHFTTLSLEEIGGYLGGRNHSTVVHAERRIKTLKAKSPDVYNIINQIEASLQGRC